MKITFVSLLPLLIFAVGAADPSTEASSDFATWAGKQFAFAKEKIFAAINPKPDAFAGTVMASPTIVKPNPDYYYHWVRDASLTMDALAGLLEAEQVETERAKFYQLALTYNTLTAHLQSLAIPDKLKSIEKDFDATQWVGEPKFNMDGTPFEDHWMRPQNDGPATRAFAMIRFTRFMLHRYLDTSMLYGNATSVTPLMKDLEYTAANWRKPSYEIWEEVKGNHFYTYMAQRRAMLDGAIIAQRFKDVANARKYRSIAKAIAKQIDTFWSPYRGYITVTKKRVAGVNYKKSELDAQIILASLHSSKDDGFYTPDSDKILATWYNLVKTFSKLYRDNGKHKHLGPAIGRYPEDQYTGYNATRNGGNGWMLLTAGMAECVYRAHLNWNYAGKFKVTAHNVAFLRYVTGGKIRFSIGRTVTSSDRRFRAVLKALIATGDSFLQNVRVHTEKDGMHLSEQWNRKTGEQQGAQDLTWSYTSFVTAYRARQRAIKL